MMKTKQRTYFCTIFIFCFVFLVQAQKKVHLVKAKETLYSLSKKYNVSIKALKKWNPQVQKMGLQTGMELVIFSEGGSKNYFLYEVKKGDTFYNLNKRYNVSRKIIEQYNPLVKEKGLQLGMTLKIIKKQKIAGVNPSDKIINPPKKNNQKRTSQPPVFVVQPTKSGSKIDKVFPKFKDSIPYIMQIRGALFLPLKLSKNNYLSDSHDALFRNPNNLINLTTEFYMGVQMAIDSLYKKGLFLDLKVYDTENNKDTLKNILDTQEDLKYLDFVIGPLYSNLVPVIAEHFKDIPILYPFFSSKQHLFNYPNLIKVAPEKKLYRDFLFDYIASEHSGENIVIVGDTALKDSLTIQAFRSKLSSKLKSINSILKDSLPNFVKSLSFEKQGVIDDELFLKAMDTLKQNWILINTKNAITTSAIINKLKTLPNDKPTRLFAFEKGKNFDKIDNQTLSSMDFTYATSEILGVKDAHPNVKLFYENFYKRNYFYPTQYVLNGFDLVYDFALRMVAPNQKQQVPFDTPKNNLLKLRYTNEGFSLQGLLKNKKRSERINTIFLYKKDTINNTVNNSILYLIKYQKDLSLKILQATDGTKKAVQ